MMRPSWSRERSHHRLRNARVSADLPSLARACPSKGPLSVPQALLPSGFDKLAVPPDVQVMGAAATDDDFVGGADQISYRVSGLAQGPHRVSAELVYQPLAYGSALDLFSDDSMEVSWNPGTPTELHRIDGYKIYWDTETGGGANGYDNSVTQPAGSGTTVMIEELDRDTEYFVTVTSLSDYTDPASGVQTQYESLLYPMTVGAGSGPLPVEASATTTCTIPLDEIASLHVDKVGHDGTIQMCWSESSDPCTSGYQIIGADTPESDTNYSPLVEDTGLVICNTLNPSESYFLVLSKGSRGTGEWGHYER